MSLCLPASTVADSSLLSLQDLSAGRPQLESRQDPEVVPEVQPPHGLQGENHGALPARGAASEDGLAPE